MENLQDCFQRKRQLTVNKKIKKDVGLSDSEAKCGILLCCSAELGHRGRHEKETVAGEINIRAIIKNINWWLPSFYIPVEQECISTHEVRARLGIEDDILRGLGMCFQQAKRARVRTGALLANLRNNNDSVFDKCPL